MASRPSPAPASPGSDPCAGGRTVRPLPEALDHHDVGPRAATGRHLDHSRRPRGRHSGRLPHGPPRGGARRGTDQFGPRRSPHRECTDGFEKYMESVAPENLAVDAGRIREVWSDAVAAPEWGGPPVWLHGDLHPANVVVTDGTLSGAIDFGDMFAGDPAWDLAAAWLLLPASRSSRFFEGYAQVDDATIRRARGLAALKSLFLILMGQNGEQGLPGGKPTWGPLGRATLDRVLTSG